jgi:hypothetical protein
MTEKPRKRSSGFRAAAEPKRSRDRGFRPGKISSVRNPARAKSLAVREDPRRPGTGLREKPGGPSKKISILPGRLEFTRKSPAARGRFVEGRENDSRNTRNSRRHAVFPPFFRKNAVISDYFSAFFGKSRIFALRRDFLKPLREARGRLPASGSFLNLRQFDVFCRNMVKNAHVTNHRTRPGEKSRALSRPGEAPIG